MSGSKFMLEMVIIEFGVSFRSASEAIYPGVNKKAFTTRQSDRLMQLSRFPSLRTSCPAPMDVSASDSILLCHFWSILCYVLVLLLCTCAPINIVETNINHSFDDSNNLGRTLD